MRTITWSTQKKPGNEFCREKGGKLQIGDHNSQKEKPKCTTWDTGGRNNKAEQRGRESNRDSTKKRVVEMDETIL